jgi:cytochrome P450
MEYTLKIALCVIASAAFGIRTNWNQIGHERESVPEGFSMSFFDALQEIANQPLKLSLVPEWLMVLPVFNLKRLQSAMRDFRKYAMQSIEQHKVSITKDNNDTLSSERQRGDLFHALVNAAMQSADVECDSADQGKKKLALDDDELLGNIYIMMLAGHGTQFLL